MRNYLASVLWASCFLLAVGCSLLLMSIFMMDRTPGTRGPSLIGFATLFGACVLSWFLLRCISKWQEKMGLGKERRALRVKRR